MRSLHALLRALRTRRSRHHETAPIANTDHLGLADLLEAARAPATTEELAGEKEVVAAFVAHRRRAARSDRRHRTNAKIRAVLVPVTAGLALLVFAGTAVAARTGNLPQDAQQHAHRLFSALGVPAPRTGNPITPAPTRPTTRPSVDVAALTWCKAWSGTPDRPLSREDRRKLVAKAGGEDGIGTYCRELHRSASAGPSQPTSPSPVSPTASAPTAPESAVGSAPPGPTDSPTPTEMPAPGQPTETDPQNPHPSKTAKPTKTKTKPTNNPGNGPPSKSKGPDKKAQRQAPVSPSVAPSPSAVAQRDGGR